jgi:hypothetical protein
LAAVSWMCESVYACPATCAALGPAVTADEDKTGIMGAEPAMLLPSPTSEIVDVLRPVVRRVSDGASRSETAVWLIAAISGLDARSGPGYEPSGGLWTPPAPTCLMEARLSTDFLRRPKDEKAEREPPAEEPGGPADEFGDSGLMVPGR